MTRLEHLLTILAEECIETGQRATKALRFTMEEVQPGQELSNAERLIYEFNDIVAMMELLRDEGYLGAGKTIFDIEAINKKKAKVEQFLQYSKELGTLD